MKPRITLSMTKDGTLELHLNESGRDKLVDLIQSLTEENDHFHLAPEEHGMECDISEIPYHRTDQVISFGKVLLRPDSWDREHFPHVMRMSD